MKDDDDDEEDENPCLSNSSDDDEGDDDGPAPFNVSLQLSASVYDDAFLAPLVGDSGLSGKRAVHLQNFRVLLPLTLLLQLLTIYHLGWLFAEAMHDFNKILFQEGEATEGYCEVNTLEEMDYDPADFQMLADARKFPNGVKKPKANHMHIDCTPYDVAVVTNFGYLDQDHDGYFSHDDALKLQHAYARDYHVAIEFGAIQRNIYTALTDYALDILASARMESEPNATRQARAVLKGLREANGSISRDIFASEVQPFHKICLLMDPQLCGNAVYRRALRLSSFLAPLEALGFSGAPLAYVANDLHRGGRVTSMVSVCEVGLRAVCPSFLAVDYQLYQANRRAACGKVGRSIQHMGPKTSSDGQQVLTVEFEATTASTLAARNWYYTTFMALVLVLWAVSMLKEVHALLIWWRVLAGFLFCLPATRRSFLVCSDEHVELQYVPRRYCRRIIILNLLPRTFICVATTCMGTLLLIFADSYTRLMLNSLVLAFLITIDRLMYAALVPSWRKEWIDKSKSLSPPASAGCDCAMRFLLSDYFLSALVCVYTLGCLWLAYKLPLYGKEDKAEIVTCLCQMSGPRCLAAWALGGYESIRAVPGFAG